MAILIPSKKIHQQEVSKVNKNAIKKIDYNYKDVLSSWAKGSEQEIKIFKQVADHKYESLIAEKDLTEGSISTGNLSPDIKTWFFSQEIKTEKFAKSSDPVDFNIKLNYVYGIVKEGITDTKTSVSFTDYGEKQKSQDLNISVMFGSTSSATFPLTFEYDDIYGFAVYITISSTNDGNFKKIIAEISVTHSALDELVTDERKKNAVAITSASVSISGTFLSDEEKSGVVGTGNISNFSIPSSEFYATRGGLVAQKLLAENIISEYKDGKETATILCEIADYYDYNTKEKVISIDKSDKMCFHIGDEVVPMVFNYLGQDAPMSLYKDGSPKVFSVIGTKIFYDGAVWQELTLQEVTQ